MGKKKKGSQKKGRKGTKTSGQQSKFLKKSIVEHGKKTKKKPQLKPRL